MFRFRPCVTVLEDRLVLSTFTEIEPNDLAAQANQVTVPVQSILTAGPADWLEISGEIKAGGDVDRFEFTLNAPTSGVFFDIDSRDTKLSTSLDAVLTVFDAADVQVGANDDGYDFAGFAVPTTGGEAEALSLDSSLYLELTTGTYQVQVLALNTSAGAYKLRLLADTNFVTTVPTFDTLPGAKDTLYLDFDGNSSDPNHIDEWGTYTAQPFDFSGNTAEFTPAEQLAIKNIWRVVSEDYSPFKINVSTGEPSVIADGIAHRQVITSTNPSSLPINPPLSSSTLGVSIIGSYTSAPILTNTAFTFASNIQNVNDDFFDGSSDNTTSGVIMAVAVEVGNTSSHEIGHTLGLNHYGGSNDKPNGLMNTPDEGLNRETWSAGKTTTDSSQGPQPPKLQDDMAIISNGINTFGYLPDDHADDIATATKLKAAGNVLSSAGIISTPDGDTDLFRFTLDSTGFMTIKVDVDEYVNDLDAVLQLYNVNRVLLATADSNASFDAFVTLRLTAGTYYARVSSDGEAGEAGHYAIQVAEMDFAAYIRQVYRDLFDRDPTAQELTKWTKRLDEGTSPTQVVTKIMDSDEYRRIVVENLFATYLPSVQIKQAILDQYVADLRHGVRREQILIKLLGGTKYYQAQGGTDDGFLEGLFRDVLDKPIDESTLIRYRLSLAMGVSRSSIVKTVATSTDALEKVVSDLTQQFLQRNPTRAELTSYVNGLLTGLGQTNVTPGSGSRVEDVIARLLSTDDYFRLALS